MAIPIKAAMIEKTTSIFNLAISFGLAFFFLELEFLTLRYLLNWDDSQAALWGSRGLGGWVKEFVGGLHFWLDLA
jgi:hypothetical protein